MKKECLVEKFGITQSCLTQQQTYIGLKEEDCQLLKELIPWAEKNILSIVKKFYDQQFSFAPTLAFFQNFAMEKEIALIDLRRHIEELQSEAFLYLFRSSEKKWGIEFFEERMKIGKTHVRINLPLKWYIGAYAVYQELFFDALMQDFPKEKVVTYFRALVKIFNYDIQAVVDSFTMNLIETLGYSVEDIPHTPARDKSDFLNYVKNDAELLCKQISSLNSGFSKDAFFDKQPKGELGRAVKKLIQYLREVLDVP